MVCDRAGSRCRLCAGLTACVVGGARLRQRWCPDGHPRRLIVATIVEAAAFGATGATFFRAFWRWRISASGSSRRGCSSARLRGRGGGQVLVLATRAPDWFIRPSILASSPSMVRLSASSEDGLPGAERRIEIRSWFCSLHDAGKASHPPMRPVPVILSFVSRSWAQERPRGGGNRCSIIGFQTQPFMKHGKQAVKSG